MIKSIHLADEVLQAFLLKEVQDDTITTHLTECSVCQKRLEAYQYLIDSVRKSRVETFSFDVTALAMNTILLYEKRKSKKQELIFWGLLLLLLIGVASFSLPFIPKLTAIFYSASTFAMLLMTGTGLGVLLFLVAAIFQQYKTKEEKIVKNNLQPAP